MSQRKAKKVGPKKQKKMAKKQEKIDYPFSDKSIEYTKAQGSVIDSYLKKIDRFL